MRHLVLNGSHSRIVHFKLPTILDARIEWSVGLGPLVSDGSFHGVVRLKTSKMSGRFGAPCVTELA